MRRLLAAGLLAALLAVSWPLAASAQGSCAALQYLDGLRQARSDLAATPANILAAATVVRGLIASSPDSTRTLRPVVDDLEATPPDVTDAAAALGALAGGLALPPGSVCNADQRPARAALSQVYASRVFAGLDYQPAPSLLSRILDFLGSLFSRAGRFLGTAGSIAVGVGVLLVALLIAAWRLRGLLGDRAASVVQEPAGDTDDPRQELRAAHRAAERGEYREAIRRAFRAALLEIARTGRLAVDASWTTHELLRAARGDAALMAALAPAAADFDRAWYSGGTVSAADWERARDRCAAVRGLARSRTSREVA